ncbi:MAG TPA: hypothetical protein VMJ10_32535, partial [Kofleriaceae bacterium]|nr:hypothetical protein [Kofleriaceae bacterium]
GTLYVGIDSVRIVTSTSSGASWTACGSVQGHEVHALAVDPSGVVYFGGSDGVFVSHDGCATWQSLDAPQGPSLALIGTDILAGTWGGLWRDHGGTWSPVSTPMDGHTIYDVEVDSTGSRVFVASDNGIAMSGDAGTTWALANTGLGGVDAQFVALDPVRPLHVFAQASNELYLSTNGAANWTAAVLAGWTTAIDPASPDFVLQSTWNGLDESVDGGTSFSGTDVRGAAMSLAAVMRMAFGPSSQLFAATSRGVFVAPDHNLAWTEIDTGLDAWTIYNITAADNGVLYLTTPSGVLVSSDAGATWKDQSQGMQWDSFTQGSVQLPGTPDTVIFASSDGVMQSVDGGSTFTAIYTTGVADGYHANKVHLVGGAVLAATCGGVVTSDANRTSFVHHDVAGATRYVIDVVAVDTAGMQLLAITTTGMFYSADGGTTFVPADSGLDANINRVAVLPDGTLLAGTDQGVFRASSPTGPWNPSGLAPSVVADLLVAQGYVIAATDLGVFSSTDGAAWTFIPGLQGSHPTSLAVDTAGRLLVGTTGYGLYVTAFP